MSHVIRFPETAQVEWDTIAAEAAVDDDLRARLAHDYQVERELEKLRVRHEARIAHDQELNAGMTPVLEIASLSSYKNTPALMPVDLVEGVVRQNGLCIMLGPGGSGKSTLALQVLHCLMSGDAFLGQPVKQIAGAVGVMSYDMDASMVMDWMSGFPGIDADRVSVVNAHKRGNPLAVPDMRKQIVEAWRAINTEVVVIDSFSASFFGQDQNDAAAAQHYYRDMLLFALTEVGAKSLIVIVHSTRSSPDTARGSTVHHDVADTIVSVIPDAKTQVRTVRMVKYRAPLGMVEMAPLMVTAPDNVTHLVGVDLGAMTLEGMHLPPGMAAQAFADMPAVESLPDTSTDSEDEEFDL